MELEIQQLVDTIKRDGVEEAKRQKQTILDQATTEGKELVDEAKQQARKIVEEAKKEAVLLRKSAEAAIQQAARDTLLSVEGVLQQKLDQIMLHHAKGALKGENLVALVSAVLTAEADEAKNSVVELNAKDLKALTGALEAALAQHLAEGAEIRLSKEVEEGFRVATKDGSSYFDFGPEGVIALLKPFLSESIRNIVTVTSEQ